MHLDVLPGQERTHAVPKEKIGKIRIFFLRHGAQGMDICDDTFVAIWMCKVSVLIVCDDGCTVAEVIIGDHIVALISCVLCKIIVSICIIYHAVADLQNCFRRVFRFPDNCMDLGFSVR